ncbi:gamma-glutamyltransferase family protein [Nocardia cyriacigeorgica]|uniref:gamma-glutamyltransferase family protein n=1 Tax=Nocardia cyriacigeorgica TaxID=135487 RepID=UPI0018959514|nr:gamma-glutamyltransferase family protein [Nocardia cyriacigeorgica]MBF6316860.1 gamma-glutamyltransferase family protein [Nocardia cyriacigeorgica]MBF6513839.1 gamma-glutamyltransferase family protein [Nocardia cyriacigeorgica]MBF6532588.1 gamma-glutamyltransferase family protein [Nocardia cyriacigeorgica]
MTRARQIRTGAAVVAALVISLAAGCSEESEGTAACTTTPNGTPLTAAPATPGGATTTQNLSTNPEIASGYRSDMTPVRTATYAVSTANPLATQAACEVLRDGGTAADALITAQTVLGLVEPQASGIGGGAFLVYYDAASNSVEAYDGRETAPAAATENYLRWVSDTDRTEPKPDARASGRSIGVPGVVRMLELTHREHGKTPWADLFDPAVSLADRGFEISPRLAGQIAESAANLAVDEAAKAYFLNPDGSPKPAGEVLTNPAMSKTLNAIATDGADAFYTGAIAQDVVEAATSGSGGRTPSLITAEDLANYQPKKRTALCTDYREHEICGMPAPSSGGITVAATLGILANFDLAAMGPDNVDRNGGKPKAEAVHLISEAERLAYADRNKYVADTDYVPLPGNSPETLVNPEYLKSRAALIDPGRSMGTAQPGDFGPVPVGVGPQPPEHGTSQISIVDSYGNAAAMTTTVESAFGSFHMVDGFFLNNQLTDFSAEPVGEDGLPLANRVEPGKRPRSSMSPTLVFADAADGSRGELTHVAGSPGGSVIIQFVVKTLVGMLDWGLDPQQAISAVSFGSANTPVTGVGGEHPAIDATDDGAHDPLVLKLRELGHQVSVAPQTSGLSVVRRDGDGWIGGADPRREGEVLGDTR